MIRQTCPNCKDDRKFWSYQPKFHCGYSEDKFYFAPCGNKKFLDEVYSLSEKGINSAVIDLVLDKFDNLLLNGDFITCDLLFGLIDVKKIPIAAGVSILGITITAPRLEIRDEFYRRMFDHVSVVKTQQYAKELLHKYR